MLPRGSRQPIGGNDIPIPRRFELSVNSGGASRRRSTRKAAGPLPLTMPSGKARPKARAAVSDRVTIPSTVLPGAGVPGSGIGRVHVPSNGTPESSAWPDTRSRSLVTETSSARAVRSRFGTIRSLATLIARPSSRSAMSGRRSPLRSGKVSVPPKRTRPDRRSTGRLAFCMRLIGSLSR